MRLRNRCCAALAASLCMSTAWAGSLGLTLDGAWFDFQVGDVGDVWRSPLDGEPITFTLASATAFALRIVDVGLAGDRVNVRNGGTTLLGQTASVPVNDAVFAFTPDEAFADPVTWSQGTWALPAGSYSFTGSAVASPFGGGAWAISALAVPEPAAWTLMLGGLVALTARARRRG